MSSWTYLIRFEATDSEKYFSKLEQPIIPPGELRAWKSFQDLISGSVGTSVTPSKLLAPILSHDCEIICIGTNYAKHAAEAKLPIPKDPVMWYKPKRALANPGDIPIPKAAQNSFLDFEGELTVVIAKDAKDISIDEAPDYILGYTVGNDLTARAWQDPKRAGGQFTRCKAFDMFAPIGPFLMHASAFGDYKDKKVVTKVNGKVFQDSPLDLIHAPAKLISFLSAGTTLPAGSLIMTGSPPGIGFFSDPPYDLKDGDEVEVEITSLGKLLNKMVFEK